MKQLVGCALIAGLVASCGASALPLELSPSWPADPPSLEVATKTWTRSARSLGGLETDVELVIKVNATFRSPQWRAAYVEHISAVGKLSKAEAAALKAKQQEASAAAHEFVLLVRTHDRRINDLAKGDRSSWTVKLRNAAGVEAAPTKIFKDRRPPAEIKAELPHLDSFDEIYIAQFPADLELLGSGDKFALRVFGARGGVEIVWKQGTR